MLRQNIIQRDESNIFLNGRPHHFSFYRNKFHVHSFLIPKTHFNIFEIDLKQIDLTITFKSEGKFFVLEPTFDNAQVFYDIYENVWQYDNYFEFKVTGKARTMDEIDIRDFRINTILENEI